MIVARSYPPGARVEPPMPRRSGAITRWVRVRDGPGVSHKMLSQTLRSLAADGLVERRVEPTIPPSVHYRLTPLGLSLDEPLAALRNWAEEHMAEIDAA